MKMKALLQALLIATASQLASAKDLYERVGEIFDSATQPVSATIPAQSIWTGYCVDSWPSSVRMTRYDGSIYFKLEEDEVLGDFLIMVPQFRISKSELNYRDLRYGSEGCLTEGFIKNMVTVTRDRKSWSTDIRGITRTPDSSDSFLLRQYRAPSGIAALVSKFISSTGAPHTFCYYAKVLRSSDAPVANLPDAEVKPKEFSMECNPKLAKKDGTTSLRHQQKEEGWYSCTDSKGLVIWVSRKSKEGHNNHHTREFAVQSPNQKLFIANLYNQGARRPSEFSYVPSRGAGDGNVFWVDDGGTGEVSAAHFGEWKPLRDFDRPYSCSKCTKSAPPDWVLSALAFRRALSYSPSLTRLEEALAEIDKFEGNESEWHEFRRKNQTSLGYTGAEMQRLQRIRSTPVNGTNQDYINESARRNAPAAGPYYQPPTVNLRTGEANYGSYLAKEASDAARRSEARGAPSLQRPEYTRSLDKYYRANDGRIILSPHP